MKELGRGRWALRHAVKSSQTPRNEAGARNHGQARSLVFHACKRFRSGLAEAKRLKGAWTSAATPRRKVRSGTSGHAASVRLLLEGGPSALALTSVFDCQHAWPVESGEEVLSSTYTADQRGVTSKPNQRCESFGIVPSALAAAIAASNLALSSGSVLRIATALPLPRMPPMKRGPVTIIS